MNSISLVNKNFPDTKKYIKIGKDVGGGYYCMKHKGYTFWVFVKASSVSNQLLSERKNNNIVYTKNQP